MPDGGWTVATGLVRFTKWEYRNMAKAKDGCIWFVGGALPSSAALLITAGKCLYWLRHGMWPKLNIGMLLGSHSWIGLDSISVTPPLVVIAGIMFYIWIYGGIDDYLETSR